MPKPNKTAKLCFLTETKTDFFDEVTFQFNSIKPTKKGLQNYIPDILDFIKNIVWLGHSRLKEIWENPHGFLLN